MVDAFDLLRCPACGTFYKPRFTLTGQMVPHCTTTIKPAGPPVRLLDGETHLKWLRGEVEIDWAAAEARTLAMTGLTDVVDPPLTVPKKMFQMFGLGVWEIVMLIALAVFLIWIETSPAQSACLMSYCKPGVSERTYITNTHRQIVGDLYTPVPGQRTQIRDTSRRIIGYIEPNGRITNTHRQKKGQLHD